MNERIVRNFDLSLAAHRAIPEQLVIEIRSRLHTHQQQ